MSTPSTAEFLAVSFLNNQRAYLLDEINYEEFNNTNRFYWETAKRRGVESDVLYVLQALGSKVLWNAIKGAGI